MRTVEEIVSAVTVFLGDVIKGYLDSTGCVPGCGTVRLAKFLEMAAHVNSDNFQLSVLKEELGESLTAAPLQPIVLSVFRVVNL